MSLNFPLQLIRASSGGVGPDTILYDASNSILASISTDVPASWNQGNAASGTTPHKLFVGSTCTTIGSNAFYFNTFAGGVVFDEGVTTINSNAFKYASIVSDLELPNSLTSIGSYAFSQGGFNNSYLSIPNENTIIAAMAFDSANFDTAFIAPPKASIPVGGYGSGAFYGCSVLTTVYVKDAVANGWTLGAGQTVGGSGTTTVANWDNWPNPIPN